jgi:hypothetical protein
LRQDKDVEMGNLRLSRIKQSQQEVEKVSLDDRIYAWLVQKTFKCCSEEVEKRSLWGRRGGARLSSLYQTSQLKL